MDRPTRVLIVDDHPLLTAGLAATVEQTPGFASPHVAGSVAEARSILSGAAFDVVVSDVRLPDGTGFEVLEDALGHSPAPAVLMLSSFDIQQYPQVASQHGASGFLLKTAPAEAVIEAIRVIAAGGLAFDRHLLRGDTARWKSPTTREAQIVAGVVAGRSNDEIAGDLGISRKTVEAHLSKLFVRCGVATRTELALRAEREGWLDLPPTPTS